MPKVFKTLLLSLVLLVGTTNAQFPDLPPGHYAESAVTRLVDLGVITGYPDGLFRGQAVIDRYQLSIILTRMWDAWSTEQFNEVWSEISGLELALTRVRQEQSLMRQELEQVGVLEARLARSEEALTLLDTRTLDVGETSRAVGNINVEVGRLQEEIASLRTQLGNETRARGEARVSVENRLTGLDVRVNRVQRQLEDVGAAQGRRVRLLEGRLGQSQRSVNARLDAQQETLDRLTDPEAARWDGLFVVAGGVNGEVADYRVGASVTTQTASGAFELTPGGPEVSATSPLAFGVDLLGRYHAGLSGNQGSVGVRFGLASGLAAGFYGGYDSGLVAGAFITQRGDEPGAALPGVIVDIGALTDTASEAGLGSELLLQGVAGLTFGGDGFNVTPRAFYRRQTGINDHQIIGGELSVGFEREAFSLAAAGRYGVATDLVTQATVSAPEADVRLTLASGAFIETELTGGLPELDNLPSFADGSPFQAEQLVLGARVGVTIPLEVLR